MTEKQTLQALKVQLELNRAEREKQFSRRIIHIDMDAFYASVEQRDNPALVGKPVIVGGKPDSRGVVAACSYEARKFGVHSAMPCSQAYRLCSDAIFIPPNIAKYRDVSQTIHQVFGEFTDLIEPLSLDEAYLDVSDRDQPATEIALAIKETIKKRVNLIASAGVSYNKFLAKLASDMDKPDGLFVIRPQHAQALLDSLPIRKFHGVGPATEKKFLSLGVSTGEQLRQLPLESFVTQFKNSGRYYYQIARGIDTREVKTSRKRVTIGTERTFADDISDEAKIEEVLLSLALKVGESLTKKELRAYTLTLKFKFTNFKQITRSKTETETINFESESELLSRIKKLIAQAELKGRSVRLLGVSCAKLVPINAMPSDAHPEQLRLLD